MHIGECLVGSGTHSAHVNVILGPKDGPMGIAFATAAASPAPGHVPFLAVLKPNLPVKPATLFISKAVLRDERHERLTWGPGQAGIAAGITNALLEGLLPPQAEDGWLTIALVWVDWNATDAELVYTNNKAAAFTAVQRALLPGWPDRIELAQGLASIGNPFYTPKQP
jgi:5,6,7,8-tetrahydromethanopterin hydro-lyase